MFDFYRENPMVAGVVLVVAVAMAAAVLALGDVRPLSLVVMGVVGGLICGAVIGFARSRRR
ncbi:MAG TPA: hypothetical protein VGV40_01885 [Solirubrobacteraceae bacterium]|nr:hypothetical protein [Solirubrobacteraceae bacterium]